jgi:hypothetical protein
LNSPGTSTMRGSGLHHNIGSPGLNHGNIPLLYAPSKRGAVRLPPAANSPLGELNASSTGGKGVSSVSQGIKFVLVAVHWMHFVVIL